MPYYIHAYVSADGTLRFGGATDEAVSSMLMQMPPAGHRVAYRIRVRPRG